MDTKPALPKVQISKDGPYMVTGSLPLGKQAIGTNAEGDSVQWVPAQQYPLQAQYALCRCGHSGHKPFCDGTHTKIGFNGTETASRAPYLEQATTLKGPVMSLTDAEALCAFARFCDPNGKVWSLVNDTDDPAARENFVRQSCECPSGRLVAWDNATGTPIEPAYTPSIVLIEDPAQDCLGPLWLRGGIPFVGADGFEYEVRNRVTLCRCGASKNKPFCDGAHASIGFSEES